MIAFFLSDIHLKDPNEPNAQVLQHFFERLLIEKTELNSEAKSSMGPAISTYLFLVGDIFDLWIGDHNYFAEKFKELVDSIRALVQAGVEVHYFEGNHDIHLKKFWEDKAGVKVHSNGHLFKLNEFSVLIEHGDRINPNDKGYLFLRWFLRTKPMKYLAENLPERVVAKMGESASRVSRAYTSENGAKALSDQTVVSLIRTYAEKRSQELYFDLFVTGHVHVFDDFKFIKKDRKVHSINLGSWFDKKRALVLRSDGQTEMLDLNQNFTFKLIASAAAD